MLRTWLVLVVGLLLGLGLGFVLFSSSAGRAAPTPSRDPTSREVQASGPQTPSLLAPPRSTPQAASAAATQERSAPRPVSAQLVQETLSRVGLAPAAARQGELEIWGRVLDENDIGLAGVVLRATGNDAKRSLKRRGDESFNALHRTLEDSMREAAQAFQETSARRFQATTDAQGYYRISGLPEGYYHVQGYLRSYRLDSLGSRAGSIPAGSEVHFRANPMVAVTIDIKLPDGTPPGEAIIQWVQTIEGRSSYERWEWTPADSVLQLPAPRVTLTAFGGIPSYASGIENSASLCSEERELKLERGAPQRVLLQLESRSGIRGHVDFGNGIVRPDDAVVRLISMGSETEVNLELLAQSEHSESVQNLGEFSFLELEPGRYALGIAREWNSPIVAHQVLEVKHEILRCSLTLPSLAPEEFLIADVRGPDGEPLRGVNLLIKRSFDQGGFNSSRLSSTLGTDGLYYATLPTEMRDAFLGDKPTGTSFSLEAMHRKFGTQSLALEPGQLKVEFRFAPPASLEVVVLGLRGSEYLGRASVHARSTQETNQRHYSNSRVDAMGIHREPALAPGEYDIQLNIQSTEQRYGPSSLVQTKRVQLTAGPNTVEITLPRLYNLDVVVPDPEAGMRLGVGIVDPETQSTNINSHVECDADGNARLSALLPGEYTLFLWGGNSNQSMKISIPSGAIVFRADSD